MANEQNLKPGEHYKHGFYHDGFLPCAMCPVNGKCPNKDKFKDHRGTPRCVEEMEFFKDKVEEIKKNFRLDSKDEFQLPQMVMTLIKLKRMNRYQAERGPVSHTLLFNPKTGAEHQMDTPNVLNRDAYYSQKTLISWLDSLKLSRQARDAKEGTDVFLHMMGK